MVDFLIHEKSDTVGVATVNISKGQMAKGLFMDSQCLAEVIALNDIPLGHKIALRDHPKGSTVVKYGYDIGKAVEVIKRGEHAHVHNIKTKRW